MTPQFIKQHEIICEASRAPLLSSFSAPFPAASTSIVSPCRAGYTARGARQSECLRLSKGFLQVRQHHNLAKRHSTYATHKFARLHQGKTRGLKAGEKQKAEQKLLPRSLERDHGIGKPGELIFEEVTPGSNTLTTPSLRR